MYKPIVQQFHKHIHPDTVPQNLHNYMYILELRTRCRLLSRDQKVSKTGFDFSKRS